MLARWANPSKFQCSYSRSATSKTSKNIFNSTAKLAGCSRLGLGIALSLAYSYHSSISRNSACPVVLTQILQSS